MKPEAYERTLKARAFDVARYLLPLATNTSLGQIVSARTLETQVSRLLSHPAAEIRDLGARLREAATGPAWNVNAKPLRVLSISSRPTSGAPAMKVSALTSSSAESGCSRGSHRGNGPDLREARR